MLSMIRLVLYRLCAYLWGTSEAAALSLLSMDVRGAKKRRVSADVDIER